MGRDFQDVCLRSVNDDAEEREVNTILAESTFRPVWAIIKGNVEVK